MKERMERTGGWSVPGGAPDIGKHWREAFDCFAPGLLLAGAAIYATGV